LAPKVFELLIDFELFDKFPERLGAVAIAAIDGNLHGEIQGALYNLWAQMPPPESSARIQMR
jgi:hypothetical protein